MPHHPGGAVGEGPRARGGFTLLEVMVALAILGSSVAAILGLLATSISVSDRVHGRVLLAELADQRLSELMLEERAEAGAGAFAPPYQAARWEARRAPGPVAGTELLQVVAYDQRDSVALATLRVR